MYISRVCFNFTHLLFRFVPLLENDSSALAAILSHEIAHVLARHSAERLGVTALFLAFRSLFWFLPTFGGDSVTSAMGIGTPFSHVR